MQVARNTQFQSFTHFEGKVLNDLKTPIGISKPVTPPAPGILSIPEYNTIALWDTGCSHCAISPKTIKELNLKPSLPPTMVGVGMERIQLIDI